MTSVRNAVLVRPGRRDDIPGIVYASDTAVTDEDVVGFGGPSSGNPFADAERLRAAWTDPNRVRSEEVIVAEVGAAVVAYVTVEDRGEALELVNIDVARDFQRRGIGRRLVEYVEARALREGRKAVTLGTSRNAAGVPWKSLPWWQSLGYRVTHEEENAWTRSIGPGAREIRMRKDADAMEEIRLRDAQPEDLDLLYAFQRDPDANRMAAFTARDPDDRPAFDAHWQRILSDGSVAIKVVEWRGLVVGSIGSYMDADFGKREVTYWIGKEYWGRGIATRALRRFLELETTRPIYARAARDNVASLRVQEKCGFVRVGSGQGWANARGGIVEEVILELAPNAPDSGKP